MIKTEFDKSQKWVIEGTGEADVYRIVKEDKSDWIAVLRCNAIHIPGMQSADGITNVKVMVAAPEMLEALKDLVSAFEQIMNVEYGYSIGQIQAIEYLNAKKAIEKATE